MSKKAEPPGGEKEAMAAIAIDIDDPEKALFQLREAQRKLEAKIKAAEEKKRSRQASPSDGGGATASAGAGGRGRLLTPRKEENYDVTYQASRDKDKSPCGSPRVNANIKKKERLRLEQDYMYRQKVIDRVS